MTATEEGPPCQKQGVWILHQPPLLLFENTSAGGMCRRRRRILSRRRSSLRCQPSLRMVSFFGS
jgi:hypothetical protein